MQIYSASPRARTRQLTADVLAIAAIALSVALGVVTYTLLSALADLGSGIEDAGLGFQSTMRDAASAIGDVPLVGRGASAPFEDASAAGSALAAAGRDQQQVVHALALLAGLIVAAVRALAGSPGGVDLLALRALSGGRDRDLLRISPNPVAEWRAGSPAVVRGLADLALRDAGVTRR